MACQNTLKIKIFPKTKCKTYVDERLNTLKDVIMSRRLFLATSKEITATLKSKVSPAKCLFSSAIFEWIHYSGIIKIRKTEMFAKFCESYRIHKQILYLVNNKECKPLYKGCWLRNKYCNPFSVNEENLRFLSVFCDWSECWNTILEEIAN